MSAAAEKLGLAEDGDQYLDRDEARRLITALAGLYAAVSDDLGAHRRPIADGLRGLQAAFREASPIPDPPGQGPGESIRRPLPGSPGDDAWSGRSGARLLRGFGAGGPRVPRGSAGFEFRTRPPGFEFRRRSAGLSSWARSSRAKASRANASWAAACSSRSPRMTVDAAGAVEALHRVEADGLVGRQHGPGPAPPRAELDRADHRPRHGLVRADDAAHVQRRRGRRAAAGRVGSQQAPARSSADADHGVLVAAVERGAVVGVRQQHGDDRRSATSDQQRDAGAPQPQPFGPGRDVRVGCGSAAAADAAVSDTSTSSGARRPTWRGADAARAPAGSVRAGTRGCS